MVQRWTSSDLRKSFQREIDGFDEAVDFFVSVVHREAGSNRSCDAEFVMQWHRAMVAVSDKDAFDVQQVGQVFG